MIWWITNEHDDSGDNEHIDTIIRLMYNVDEPGNTIQSNVYKGGHVGWKVRPYVGHA